MRWQRVVGLLEQTPEDTPAIALATVEAADRRLRELANDPSLGHCFHVLVRLAEDAQGPAFAAALETLGLDPHESPAALTVIGRITDNVRAELAQHPESGPFGELASLAMRRALSETVGQEGRSLFGSSAEDIAEAFRRHGRPERFGIVARGFFGDFLARTLRFFVDKELANTTGGHHALRDSEDARAFDQALDLYARQSARILQDFGPEWYPKHHWESAGAISRQQAQGFVAHALQKLRAELRVSAT
jgi:hypothetical protein